MFGCADLHYMHVEFVSTWSQSSYSISKKIRWNINFRKIVSVVNISKTGFFNPLMHELAWKPTAQNQVWNVNSNSSASSFADMSLAVIQQWSRMSNVQSTSFLMNLRIKISTFDIFKQNILLFSDFECIFIISRKNDVKWKGFIYEKSPCIKCLISNKSESFVSHCTVSRKFASNRAFLTSSTFRKRFTWFIEYGQ